MRLRTTVTATGVIATLLTGVAAAGASASARPGPGFGIEVQNLHGSGCRKKDTDAVLSNDNMALTIIYSGFVAELGRKAKDARKECRLTLRVKAPKGNRYTVTGIQQRGYADIAQGATGTFTAVYNYPGKNPLYTVTRDFGPTVGAWQDNTPAAAEWSPCDAHKPFKVDTDLIIKGKGDQAAGSSLTIDSTDVDAASTTLRLRWEKC
ncbi:hypothetical protein GCM10010124_10960 [Pilimelia terevasa]|uniref:DUF4360 domain-containing protein n=1 Tax=Pilimelia terevasa TaxID=53372 RepID=A0A8J3BGS1_9ACTN|nr:DUF4360 domain-containing protein [Pilimelia terevasa]GGK20162.1 hypothetical protein GCM10010124_10960 [Pilimelia terevasa]